MRNSMVKFPVLVFFPIFIFILNSGAEGQDKIINIQEYSAKEHSPTDTIQHKLKDLEIFRYQDTSLYRQVIYPDDTIKKIKEPVKLLEGIFYEICIWGRSKESPESITLFEFHDLKEEIDGASYHWVNDSHLLMRVYNSKSNGEINLRFFGDIIYPKKGGGCSANNG